MELPDIASGYICDPSPELRNWVRARLDEVSLSLEKVKYATMPFLIRELLPAHLNAISDVHLAAFPDSALTKLGKEIVRRYYEWQMIGPHKAVNIGAFDGEQLVGFCFGGVFRGALGGFLERNRRYLIRQTLTHPWLLFNPLFRERASFASQRIFRRFSLRKPATVSAVSSPRAETVPSFGILSIAVAPQYQGSGAARLLMEYSEAAAVGRGFKRMHLTVHPSNARAVHFYEKMGWQREEQGEVWSGSMSKPLV